MTAIEYSVAGDGIAILALNRPRQLNALNDEILEELPELLDQVRRDHDVRVLVITGRGRAFSAGADLDCSGFQQDDALATVEYLRRVQRAPMLLHRLPQPAIAAIDGPAVGAGLGLALACDFRIASPRSKFISPFVQMGLVPDFGVTYFLPRLTSRDRALSMLLTGEVVEGSEAQSLGLVTAVVDDPLKEAQRLASKLATAPRSAVATTKRNMYRSMEISAEQEILEQEALAQAVSMHSPEFREKWDDWRRNVLGGG